MANRLAKGFGGVTAVRAVSLSLVRGETLGLLGPNGAGKSTTMHMLAGLLAPDTGNIAPDPRKPNVRRQLGFAPQEIALYDSLSASENLHFTGGLYGMRGARLRERVGWALDFAGLAERRHDRVGGFSGGMKRRLNLAASLVHEPEVLLLDEPTAGVDPQSRNHLLECIAELRRAGLSILYSTHYMEEAERLCDRVAIIDRGRILANDSVSALVARHGGRAVVDARLTPEAQAAGQEGTPLTDVHIQTDRPLQAVAEMVNAGVRFQELHVQQPSLESVFLSLTGRAMRD